MGNRVVLKDLVLIAMVIILILSVWLSMKQRDREWEVLQSIRDQGDSQSHDLSAIRRSLASGIRLSNASATTQGTGAETMEGGKEKDDPFKYVKQAETQPGYATGDWFLDNLHTKVGDLTPLLASNDLYSQIVQGRVLESLVYQDPNTLEYLPLLARSWQITDKGLTFTFQLRQGITFSDGVSFTADDVIFTFNWIMNPAVEAPRDRAYLDKIASVTKHGDYEVVFKFKEPYFLSMDLAGGMNILPKHFYEKYTPTQFNGNPGLLMGTGPYMLRDPSRWRPGDPIELVRNDRYWGETPSFDRIVYEQVEEDAAALTMFKNGDVDTFSAQPEQYELLLKDADLLKHTQHFELDTPLSGYNFIGWNEKRNGKPTFFADKRARRAMTLLTDRERICKEVLLGYATVANGPFSPLGKPQTAPGLQPYPYDPDQARKILKELGYEDRNGSGVVQTSDGKPFEFTFTYPAKDETLQRIVMFIRDSYARAGVKMNLDPVDFPILIQKLNNRDFDAATLGWSGEVEDDLYQIFHSSQIADQGDDFVSYVNPELDKLIEEARRTVDEPTRMKLWQRCSEILHEDQPYTFLTRRKALSFMAGRITNVHPSKVALNFVSRWNMPCPWYVPKGLQKWGK